MKIQKIFKISTFFLSLVLFFSIIFPAKAAKIEKLEGLETRNDFVLGPPSYSLEVKKGEALEKEIIITNRLGKVQKFQIETEDFIGSSDPANPVVLLGENAGKWSAKNWLKTELEEFTLEHGERIYLKVVVDVPADAEPGEHYAGVFIKTVPLEESQENAAVVQLSSRLGSLFLINVEGEKIEKGAFKNFEINKKYFFSKKDPLLFNLFFENEGTVHLRPHGNIQIKNSFGNKLENLDVGEWIVLRNSQRLKEVSFQKPWMIGKYQATANLYYGVDNQKESKEISFYVFPWQLITLLVIVIFLAILLICFFRKSKNNQKNRKENSASKKTIKKVSKKNAKTKNKKTVSKKK
jgi:hypothetical protein